MNEVFNDIAIMVTNFNLTLLFYFSGSVNMNSELGETCLAEWFVRTNSRVLL